MSRREEPVILVEREGSASVVWFLVGGAVGAALALLFAPHSGDHTRRVLSRRIARMRDAADQALADLKDAIGREPNPERVPPGDAGGEAAAESAEDTTPSPEPRRGVSAARRELEQRLAEARSRRQRALADENEEPVA